MFITKFEAADVDKNLYLELDEVKESLKDVPALIEIL